MKESRIPSADLRNLTKENKSRRTGPLKMFLFGFVQGGPGPIMALDAILEQFTEKPISGKGPAAVESPNTKNPIK